MHTHRAPIWWSNAIFFVTFHLATLYSIVFWRPPSSLRTPTAILAILSWQLCNLAITIGYHRLYSHRAFHASLPVRVVLALFGSAAFQGSIKWWCLRHRLHHRFTDHPLHDPYAATRGLLFSHVGWIFFKPKYEKLASVDARDLNSDVVVRMQHRYFVPLAVIMGILLPTFIASLWGDAAGGFVWAALVARIITWHTTFIVNSLAHWEGLQPYSDEMTARGNLLFALLTGGEGNHNFHHVFPYDYRANPSKWGWDPSKWTILLLKRFGHVTKLKQAKTKDIQDAQLWMTSHHVESSSESEVEAWTGAHWTTDDLGKYLIEHPGHCLLYIEGYIVDASSYLKDHPGGIKLLKDYAIQMEHVTTLSKLDATGAFHGGVNIHTRIARRTMRRLRTAFIVSN